MTGRVGDESRSACDATVDISSTIKRNVSQNVKFCGPAIPHSHFDHPLGFGISRYLQVSLLGDACDENAIENWRDCGWAFTVGEQERAVDIILLGLTIADAWIVQIAAVHNDGLLARIFGKHPLDLTNEIYQISSTIHEVLAMKGYSDIMWQIDDFPESDTAVDRPTMPRE